MKLRRAPALLRLVFPAAALAFAACVPRAQRAQEAAYDLAMGARFGRLDIALENVAPASRDTFMATHRGWHHSLRIVDLELTGIRLRDDDKGAKGADVTVAIGWNRSDETVLRQTTLLQRWHDDRGRWYLTDEQEVGGDEGLLQPIAKADASPKRDVGR